MDWLTFIAPDLRRPLSGVGSRPGLLLEEVRLRAGGPLHVVTAEGDGFVTAGGALTAAPGEAVAVTAEHVLRTFQLAARGSVHTWEEELRGGFLTLPGGHRLGIAGRAVLADGRLRTFRPVTALNLRLARAVAAAARPLLPRLHSGGRLTSTLLLSPPRAGKTTVLRDLVRAASAGDRPLVPHRVVVIDERGEVAGNSGGVPALDLGPRTDVLDGCPKAEGLMLAIRALGPDVVAVDEIGRPGDALAVGEALLAGVTVLATAHAASLDDAMRRPALQPLFRAGAFRHAVVLSRRPRPGSVEHVWDLTTGAAGRAV